MGNMSNANISHHLLKRLTTLHSYTHYFMIDAPNLAHFKSISHVATGYSLKNLESIVSADIHFVIEYNYLQADATALFRGICSVRSLVLSATSLMLLSCEPLPVFANLMELDMRYYYGLIDWSSSDKGLETLLASSQLEKLYFIQEVLCSLPQKVPCCLLYKLKTIKITNFTDEKDCIGKAKNILTNGGALQKLTIRTGLYISEEEKLETYQVLLASPRKSKQCRILFI
ncbi:hypothetical protein ERO13_D01G063300v2 [Gossypium hirsutum]|uniref:F-box/FBD/LRR-repeat protein At1g78750 n=1 Tax=Gossypium hirsutum TaxID=3635 RepID=A0A1U8LPJ3_GOSHI|nr:F-box/FBD/LRR-repeat protein At1g78750-like [Gossypium hirsutum]KAG4161557.1 hypothetical protein ERO13_D01G063300v2 [Gossypium hirsutum]